MNKRELLRPERAPNESQKDYRARRAGTALAIERYLKGRLIHVSKDFTFREGKIVWSEGVTFRKPKDTKA